MIDMMIVRIAESAGWLTWVDRHRVQAFLEANALSLRMPHEGIRLEVEASDEKQLNILWQGVNAWNTWRQAHPEIRTDLSEDILSGASLSGVNLSETDLSGTDLSGADLTGADFSGAILSGAILSNANLSGVNLSGASLSGVNLGGVNLSGMNLGGAVLSKAILSNTDLSRADLRGTDFSGADLTGADLSEAVLNEVDLRGADLTGADLSSAQLRGADFRQTNLSEANLNGSILTDAYLWEAQRVGWSIQGVICEAVHWDKNGEERTIYGQGEFERLYADKTKIVLHYEDGLSPLEVATLPVLIQQIEVAHPGCVLRLQSIQEAPSGATVILVVEEVSWYNPVEIAELKNRLEGTGKILIARQRKRLEEENIQTWAKEELSRREKIFASLVLNQEEE